MRPDDIKGRQQSEWHLREGIPRIEVDGIAFWVALVAIPLLVAAWSAWSTAASVARIERMMAGQPPAERRDR